LFLDVLSVGVFELFLGFAFRSYATLARKTNAALKVTRLSSATRRASSANGFGMVTLWRTLLGILFAMVAMRSC